MENRINQIMTLEDGQKYLVVKQAVYKNENYYAVVKVDEQEENLLDEYLLLHEVEYDGQVCIEELDDPEMIKLVTEYLGIASKEEWNEQ